ncbi:MAG: histidine kinase N-terminal domain-containing protein, partial [Glutamicibacter sp.]
MALITEELRQRAALAPGDEDWLHLLVGDWQLVSDLAFA